MWPAQARLHVVTGKGGTGKTTVAAALAVALATGGRKTLLVEVEGRQGIAHLFDVPPMPYQERRVAVVPGGGEVRALAVDAEEALLEYFAMFYNLGFAGRTLRRMGAIEFATTLAPRLPGRFAATTGDGNGQVVADRVRAGLLAAGLDLDDAVVDGLVAETGEHAMRVDAEQHARARLADAGMPLIELPDLTEIGGDGADLEGIYQLAELLREQGVR